MCFKVLTAFGQTAFGQFWCFNVLAKFPGWCLLVPVGACWCLLVPVGACWCLLVPVGGACWWCLLVCSRFSSLSPGPPPDGPPFPWTAQNFALFFLSSRRKFLSFFSLWGVFSLNFGGVLKTRTLKCARFRAPALQTPPKFHEQTPR